MAFSFGVEILNMRMLKSKRKPVQLREPVLVEEEQSGDMAK
jgi:hypothetical protein